MVISQSRALELFSYDDGILKRKSFSKYSSVKVGYVVGCPNTNGYLQVMADRKLYLVHRLVFLMHHGWMPEYVDHADRNILNNKIENLRAASASQNSSNSKRNTRNQSGYKGVSWNPRIKRWIAEIRVNGKKAHLGCFKDAEDAALYYFINALRHNGEFARV